MGFTPSSTSSVLRALWVEGRAGVGALCESRRKSLLSAIATLLKPKATATSAILDRVILFMAPTESGAAHLTGVIKCFQISLKVAGFRGVVLLAFDLLDHHPAGPARPSSAIPN